ncbi:hypothetical protein M2322_004126 [Rhodoblastus acidophilus]|uniref:hypothetical protein n=1 Tax=Rhodoblastus acidophilus TaxID=1074 RepID=UPI0022256DA7|nr:hypothetical protein [Rhodoblastus acidophilus]MCW2318557.1 hypothetical protein [Rhodoblastus acidophilus]
MSVSASSRLFTVAALTATAIIALASSGVSAFAKSDRDNAKSREYRAGYEAHAADRCVSPNGAQIMGGFAGPDDLIDSVTGQICPR